ncbi:hypothetical protein BDV23DRAFT_178366 [Aspergillus alliaceus]|uniref:Uncharacterized protein n=1 Tax=Petromyces alliaceus TaxID=209559 RepID=A0A5N7CNF5_PETAA|nr:hypothetical protein BDV23DRAFT_178366 [Aspergillus alliaceus]
MQWQEGRRLCDESLEYCATSGEETSFQHSQLHSIRESWESALVGKSLLAAEAAADFYMCRIAQPPRKALEAPAARVKAKFGSLLDAERESHQIPEALLPR